MVFVVKISRHGGDRPERFLLIGVSLMLFGSLVYVVTAIIMDNLINSLDLEIMGPQDLPPVFSFIAIFRKLIGLAGIVCLMYAFWLKFSRIDSRVMKA